MRILWIVNIMLPSLARIIGEKPSVFGGWLESSLKSLRDHNNYEFAVATVYPGKKVKQYNTDNISFFLIPQVLTSPIKYSKKQEYFWHELLEIFSPDIIHIHGTEFSYGLACINARKRDIPIIISIQGLMHRCADEYFGGIRIKDIITSISFRDLIKLNSVFTQQKNFYRRSKYEIEMLGKAAAIIGRTTWDHANTHSIAPNVTYYSSNESLRDLFYQRQWELGNVRRHSIFISQAGYPIKGFHVLLKAISLLKREFPDILVTVAGPDLIHAGIAITGYGVYLRKLIKRYELSEYIRFKGILDEPSMIECYLSAHTYVLPSIIENSPNSLCEAMILGMPCVSANVGGVSSLLIDRVEGFLYPYPESALLAHYLKLIWTDDDLALKISSNARAHAQKTHDKEKNASVLLEIYKSIRKSSYE